jgi:hypothetical protein
VSSWAISAVSAWVAAGHGGHGRFNRPGWAGEVAGAEPGRRRDSLGGGQGGQLLPHRLGGSDDQAAELVAGLGAGLDRAAAGLWGARNRPGL